VKNNLPHVDVVERISAAQFRDEIVPGNRPVLLKGQVADWPAVRAGTASDNDICEYLQRCDSGRRVETIFGDADIEGRFFYNESMTGLNFDKRRERIGRSIARIRKLQDDDRSSIYIQSVPVAEFLPGFSDDNRLDLVGGNAEPRIWIGNRVRVQTHFDLRENVACVVAGHRRFTMFPPEQTPNLYPGPFELTLSGPPVSMVELENPDLDRYPRFAAALESAVVADLEPGDALYIPYFWWHHVRALDAFNVLVNYWWNDADKDLGSPYDAMLHAVLAIRDLPERQRAAWRTMFDTYVFGGVEGPVEHLPEQVRGPLGSHDSDIRQRMRMILISALAQQAGIRPPRRN
jgi:hypothetical protein